MWISFRGKNAWNDIRMEMNIDKKRNMNIEQLKYPIGAQWRVKQPTDKQRAEWIQTIEEFPKKVGELVLDLSSEKLNWIYRPEGWSIKQVVNHCIDSHMNSVIRFKLALTENKPTIRPYHEARWAELADDLHEDMDLSIQQLSTLHQRWTILLKSLSAEQLQRQLIHPDEKDLISVDELIGMYAWHCDHHRAHVEQALEHRGAFNESNR